MRNQFYDLSVICKYLAFIIGLGIAMKFTQGAAFILLLPYALISYSRRNAEGVFFTILVSVLTIVTNSWLMPKGMIYAVCQRGLMAGLGMMMVLQLFGQRSSSIVKPLLGILIYVVYMIPVSMAGWSPIVSGLKIFLFIVVFIALYTSANMVIMNKRIDMRNVRNMLLATACFFVIGSLLVMPFPGISYLSPEAMLENPDMVSLFRGITGHSQMLGPVMTMIGILVFADLVFSIQKPDKLYIAILIIVPIMIIKTSSRTAMGAFLGGVMIIIYQLLKARGVRIHWRNKVFSTFFSVVILGALTVLAIPKTRESVLKFVVKYGDSGGMVTTEQILSSRQAKLDGAIENWKKSPFVGNGFQVGEEMAGFQANSVKDILSAPVEKSTWTHAILEEGGVVGETIFVIFLIAASSIMFKRQAYVGGSLFVAFVVSNLGEFTIFSMSGGGGFFWELVFLGCVIDAKRLQARNQRGPIYFGPTPPIRRQSVGYNPMWR